MQPEKGQYPRLNRHWLVLALLVVTAMLTAVGPAGAENSSSPRGRIDAIWAAGETTGIAANTKSHTRSHTTNLGGSDATWRAGDGQSATPFPDGALPPVTIAGAFSANDGARLRTRTHAAAAPFACTL